LPSVLASRAEAKQSGRIGADAPRRFANASPQYRPFADQKIPGMTRLVRAA
jgi:hypothetical protein